MNDAGVVRVLQRVADLPRDLHDLREGQLPVAVDARAQRIALDEGRDVERDAVPLPRIQHREQVRMIQASEERDLLPEARGGDGVGELWAQELDGHAATELAVARTVDDAGAAPADLAFDLVAFGNERERRDERLRSVD